MGILRPAVRAVVGPALSAVIFPKGQKARQILLAVWVRSPYFPDTGLRSAPPGLATYFSPKVAGFLDHFQSSLSDFRHMADFTKEWIEHLKAQISGRMSIVADKMDPQSYDELVTDLAWFTFRFARDPDTKMRKVFR
jgi:hypothetical protein